jgi:polysaccharide pyruvyl transferase WcaK-like protein/sulfatase maturation enzyme AslB (radical SAM superfamily)
MCRIWENKKSDDLSVEQLRLGLRNQLFSEVASVGINGGEPTLRKDLGQLVSVLFEELPKLQSISLITNAYNFEQVIARISDVGDVVKCHNGFLDVMISLDGFGEVHDKVRGKPGNFERAQHVIDFAKNSKLVHNVRIGCTIIKENVYGLNDLFEYCQSKDLYIKYRLGIPHQRLYTKDLVEPYLLDDKEKYHIAEFLEGLITHYETNEDQKYFYRSLIDQIIHLAPRKSGCEWKHRGATITSKGELLYCAVQSKVLGNITENKSKELYFGNKNHLDDIINNHCDNCNHDYVGMPPRIEHAKQLIVKFADKINAQNLLKILYQKLIVNNRYRRNQFWSNFEKISKYSLTPLDWPTLGIGKRILICGWYGTETLGDKGILGGILQALKEKIGEIDVILVSINPYVTEMTRSQMPELCDVRIVTREQGVQLAAQADLIVFGGGPLMAIDETGEMLAIFETAKKAGRKTLIAGCGVGPLGEEWHNSAIKQILQLSDARIYRDENSRILASKLGVNDQNDQVAEDPAFTWLLSQKDILSQEKKVLKDEKVLLLGLRDFPHITYARHLNKLERNKAKLQYELSVIKALEKLVMQYPNLIIRPLPMCTNHFGDDDRWYYRRLFRGNEMLSNNLDFSLLGQELPPIEYCKAFKNANAALTMRFHSVVFALGFGIPTVAIDYTLGKGKVQALADRFDISYRSLSEIDTDFLFNELSLLLDGAAPKSLNFTPTFTQVIGSVIEKLELK